MEKKETSKTLLIEIVENLRSLKKEGTYWDFKKEHHAQKHELLHDILCLSNAQHDGDRYLIYGVEDKTFDLCCVSENNPRREQADILDFLKDNQSKFARDIYPAVQSETLIINGNQIDVVIIKDTSDKPYYLTQLCHKVKANHIYSRVMDTNTPFDQSASPADVERMWRERFGLNKSPLQRAQTYLMDYDGWTANEMEVCVVI